MDSQCLASTGTNVFVLVAIGAALVAVGALAVRRARMRTALVVLALVAGGLVTSQALAKPAGAACLPAAATTSTTMPASTTTTSTVPTTGFTFTFSLDAQGAGGWTALGCSNFTATIAQGQAAPSPITNVSTGSFPGTQFTSGLLPNPESTTYTITFGWSCQTNPNGLGYFLLNSSNSSNLAGPANLGNLSISGSGPYEVSNTVTFTTPTNTANSALSFVYSFVLMP